MTRGGPDDALGWEAARRPGAVIRGHSDVGGRVRAVRVRRGVSLRGLARRLDVSAGTMSQIETGKTGLSVARLHQIGTALGTTPNEILETPVLRAAGSPGSTIGGGRAQPPGSPSGPDVTDWRVYGPLDLDAVLGAALTVFTRRGYHGATVRDIARECGRSMSSIYHHYPSKQAMLRRILDRGVTELLVRAQLAQASGGDPVERFRFLIESLALFHTHRRAMGFLGASEMRSLEPTAFRDIAGRRVGGQRMVDTEVLAAVAAGRFDCPRPREASRAVVTMCTSIAQWYQPEGSLSPAEVAADYVAFACDVMRLRPHHRPEG